MTNWKICDAGSHWRSFAGRALRVRVLVSHWLNINNHYPTITHAQCVTAHDVCCRAVTVFDWRMWEGVWQTIALSARADVMLKTRCVAASAVKRDDRAWGYSTECSQHNSSELSISSTQIFRKYKFNYVRHATAKPQHGIINWMHSEYTSSELN